jgi:mono/diheme cytochrome c family protein
LANPGPALQRTLTSVKPTGILTAKITPCRQAASSNMLRAGSTHVAKGAGAHNRTEMVALINDWLMPVIVASSLACAPVAAQPVSKPGEPRGELLYSTYCIACHTTEIHWRDKKLVTDWASLKAQVRRWQATTGVVWSESDIGEVTRYLNELYYRYRQVDGQASIAKTWQGSKM